MNALLLDRLETWVRWLGGAGIVALSIAVLVSVIRARSRRIGRVSGQSNAWLRSPWFLTVGTLVSLIVCWLLWQPIPVPVGDSLRVGLLIGGGLLYFGGLGLTAWGRIALGKMHNVSSSLGAELFDDQRLITSGPFAYLRHPMYAGALLMGVSALLLYRTWTVALLALSVLNFFRRARKEEQVLAAEFGEEWAAYCRRVPAWIPRIASGEAAARNGPGVPRGRAPAPR